MKQHRHKFLKKLFGFPKDVGFTFSVQDWFFKRVLRFNTKVKWPVHFTSSVGNPENIVRGKGVYPGDSAGTYINAKNGISIGDYTNMGPNVGLISANHDFYDNTKHVEAKPIKIGAHCWIGMGAIILPEVELGDFTIVGAGSIVTQSFAEGYCVIAGNPAKIIRKIEREKCEAIRITSQTSFPNSN